MQELTASHARALSRVQDEALRALTETGLRSEREVGCLQLSGKG